MADNDLRTHNMTVPPIREIKMDFSDATVYIVDDDLKVRRDLSKALVENGLSVRTFASLTRYIEFQRPDKTACLILDLHLPGAQGPELQRTLAENEAPPVVFTTEFGDIPSIVRAMRNGALEFLSKPVNLDQLFAVIKAAFLEDSKRRSDRIIEGLLIKRWTSLTPREAEVFKYVVEGYLNKQAAAELGITENTFQVHRGRIMKKMEAKSFAELVRMAMKLETSPVQFEHPPSRVFPSEAGSAFCAKPAAHYPSNRICLEPEGIAVGRSRAQSICFRRQPHG